MDNEKILFFCAIENNEYIVSPEKIIQNTYLSINNIEDFKNMNILSYVDPENYHLHDLRKILTLTQNLNNNLYKVHILSTNSIYICLIEININLLYNYIIQKQPIPNYNLLFKICHRHNSLTQHKYFSDIFYNVLLSQIIQCNSITNSYKEKINNWLDLNENNENILINNKNSINLGKNIIVNIPVGNNTGGYISLNNTLSNSICLNGGIILSDNCIDFMDVFIDYNDNLMNFTDINNLYSYGTLIITYEEKLLLWLEKLKDKNALCIKDHNDITNITYNSLCSFKYVIVSDTYLHSKEYSRLWNKHKIGNLKDYYIMNLIRKQYLDMHSKYYKNEKNPILSVIEWHRVIYDHISFRPYQEDIIMNFNTNNKIFYNYLNKDSVELGIKLFINNCNYLLTFEEIQNILLDKILICSKENITNLPNIVNNKILITLPEKERFCYDYCEDNDLPIKREICNIPCKNLIKSYNYCETIEDLYEEINKKNIEKIQKYNTKKLDYQNILTEIIEFLNRHNIILNNDDGIKISYTYDNFDYEKSQELFKYMGTYSSYNKNIENINNEIEL